jgi:hypothetical protein
MTPKRLHRYIYTRWHRIISWKSLIRIPFPVYGHPCVGVKGESLRFGESMDSRFISLLDVPAIVLGNIWGKGPYDMFDHIMLEGDV